MSFDVYCATGRPVCVDGLCTFCKRAVMYGSEGSAKIFSSHYAPSAADLQRGMRTNAPEVSVEVVDPIILGSKLVDNCDHCCCCDADMESVPEAVCCCFDDALVSGGGKRLYVSLGIFTIIRISRNVQLLIPAYDFCIPDKESECSEGDGPCELFKKFKFPINEFFPPREEKNNDGCCKSSC